jgi:hypothetical protein
MGVVITHVFQRLASRRSELFARSEALRQERMATYSSFAAAAENYRHGQADRWYRKQEDRTERPSSRHVMRHTASEQGHGKCSIESNCSPMTGK